MDHDALELPSGQVLLLTRLREGQHATVLQLPATERPHEAAQERRKPVEAESGGGANGRVSVGHHLCDLR
jgi:hypothetical protein